MKISRAYRHALFPKPLLKSRVPPKTLFRLQRLQRLSRVRIESKDLVLAARRTEARRHTRVQRRVRPVDLIATRDPVSPNIAELIEMIDPSTGDEDQVVNRR